VDSFKIKTMPNANNESIHIHALLYSICCSFKAMLF